MTDQEPRPRPGYFVVDGAYLRTEAREALRTLLAPFTWPFLAGRWVSARIRDRRS